MSWAEKCRNCMYSNACDYMNCRIEDSIKHDKLVKMEFAEKLLTQLKAMTTEISIGDFYGDDFLRLSDVKNEIEQLIK